MTTKLLGVALAGAFGTVARYTLSQMVESWRPAGGFPWGTLVVNALGCFGFGLIWSVAGGRAGLSAEMRLFVLTGFLGAFTTFSTFQFETGKLLQDAQWLTALGNILGQNALGVSMLVAGVLLGRML